MQITYLSHFGDDLEVVNDAKVSFNKREDNLTSKGEKLISYLAKHDHWTPFAHQQVKCRVSVPIFIARQFFKHQVGAVYNEVSRRYVDYKPSFWSPDSWRARPDKNIKQGSGTDLPNQAGLQEEYEDILSQCLFSYQFFLDKGVCPEQARSILPQAMMTEFIVTGSLIYWARLYSLRNEKTSQKEWQTLTGQLNKIMLDLYPISWKELSS